MKVRKKTIEMYAFQVKDNPSPEFATSGHYLDKTTELSNQIYLCRTGSALCKAVIESDYIVGIPNTDTVMIYDEASFQVLFEVV